jgi:hypothetical protein
MLLNRPGTGSGYVAHEDRRERLLQPHLSHYKCGALGREPTHSARVSFGSKADASCLTRRVDSDFTCIVGFGHTFKDCHAESNRGRELLGAPVFHC